MPMGLCNSPDIFQEKMNELFVGFEDVRAYLDDCLLITSGTYEHHLERLDKVLNKLRNVGLKVNASKSFFAKGELKYLGYWITRDGIQPLPDKIKAIQNIAEPTTRKQLRGFIGMINYYRDMWSKRSHYLAPLSRLTSNTVPFKWTETESKAFKDIKKMLCRETMLAFPDYSKAFEIHTDASAFALGAVISQDKNRLRHKPVTLQRNVNSSALWKLSKNSAPCCSVTKLLSGPTTKILHALTSTLNVC